MSTWTGRRVLVTGAGGFVGGHLCRSLLDLGAEVDAGDIRPWPWPTAEMLGGPTDSRLPIDVTDFSSLVGYMKASSPSVIFHLAGIGHIHEAQAWPHRAFEINVRGAWNLLEAARQVGGVQAIVLASSNHVYGSGHYHRKETDHLRQSDVYGTSKACADFVARCYAKGFGMPIATLRHVNCYGPADPHSSHLVTGTILSLLKGERPFIRGDGSARKAYLHVEDVISAYLHVAEALSLDPAEHGGWYNVAPYGVTEVYELVALLMALAGMPGQPEIRNIDTTQSGYEERLSSQRIRGLGWEPRRDLISGLEDTLIWYRAHGGMAWLP